MKRERKLWWVALVAVLLLLAACKGETPTAPPPGGAPGGGTPVTGSTVTLSVSNPNPLVDSTVVITATVTKDGQPVVNGTAVQFTTTRGTFTDTNPPASSTIRTTTNGVATATLTSSAAGAATITAIVNDVSRTIAVTFGDRPVEPPCVPPDPRCPVLPTITSVNPPVGRPEGGEKIIITGTAFKAPVRVLFDTGTGVPLEAGLTTLISSTQIEAITPAVNLGAGQQLVADIILLNEAGTTNERRVVANDSFTFRNTQLTPIIHTLTPNSGPINGGTRVTIVGTAFQPPVQVLFGSAEARVVEENFSQIIVIAPEGRATNPDGSGTVTGPVAVTVVNIASNTRATSPEPFRYVANMQITAVTPLVGSALGGTILTIDGIGFDAPVDVLIAGVQAQVLDVSGTRLRVRANALAAACVGAVGAIVVTNVENGDSATAPNQFQYIGVPPQILSIIDDSVPLGDTPDISPGEVVQVTVDDPGVGPLGTANIRFQVVGATLIPSPSQITDPLTPQAFDFALPLTGFNFPTVACSISGSPGVQFGPVEVPITFLNTTTGCTDVATITVVPPSPNPCIVPPQAVLADPATGCATPADTTVGGPPTTDVITFSNVAPVGAQNLVVTRGALGGTNPGDFTVTPANRSIPGGGSDSFTVTFTPTAPGARSATVTFTTNDPNNPTFTVCLSSNGL